MHSKSTKPMTMALLVTALLLIGANRFDFSNDMPTLLTNHSTLYQKTWADRGLLTLNTEKDVKALTNDNDTTIYTLPFKRFRSDHDHRPSFDWHASLPIRNPPHFLPHFLTVKTRAYGYSIRWLTILEIAPSEYKHSSPTMTTATAHLSPKPMENMMTEPPPSEVPPPSPAAAPDPTGTDDMVDEGNTEGNPTLKDTNEAPAKNDPTNALISDTEPLDTKLNMQCFDLIKQIPDGDYKDAAASAYKSEFGDGLDSYHDDHAFIRREIRKMERGTAVLDQEDINDILKNDLPADEYFTNFTALALQDKEKMKVIHDYDIPRMKAIMSRLSFTPSNNLFVVRNSKIENTGRARAWRAAQLAIGSHHALQRKKQDKEAKAKAKQRFKDQTAPKKQRQTLLQFETAKDVIDLSGGKSARNTSDPQDQTKTVTPDAKAANKRSASDITSSPTGSPSSPPVIKSCLKKKGMKAAEVLVDGMQEGRIQMKLVIKAVEGKTSEQSGRELVQDFYETVLIQDPKAVIFPWNTTDQKNIDVISDPAKIRSMSPTEWKVFADRFRPEPGKPCWVKLAMGVSMEIHHLESKDESNMSGWYDDKGCQGYLCTVQGSSDTKQLGEFLYSGPFIDTNRLQAVIQAVCIKEVRRPLKFGIRARKNPNIKRVEDKTKGWILAENQPCAIEVDVGDEKYLKAVLYVYFNKESDFKKRPGQYAFRFLPDKKASSTGSVSPVVRHNSLRKHSSVITSLMLIKSTEIKALDKPVTIDGQVYTLRDIIVNATNPLLIKEDDTEEDNTDKPRSLFHSVDFEAKGKDAGKVVYFTAYHDMADLAERFVAILPAYVDKILGPQVPKEWFHADSLTIIKDVKFGHDLEGNWDGTWKTTEEDLMLSILEEDMHTNWEFDDIHKVEQGIVSLMADEASLQTFGEALGISDQQTGEEPTAELAAAGSTGRGGAAK